MSDIKMTGPKDSANTLSFDGQVYTASKKGVFTVPVEAFALLIGHGFTAIGEPKTEEELAAEEADRVAAEEAATEADRVAAEEAAAKASADADVDAAAAAGKGGK